MDHAHVETDHLIPALVIRVLRVSLTSWRWRMKTELLCCSSQTARWPTWLASATATPTSSCRTRWQKRTTSRGTCGFSLAAAMFEEVTDYFWQIFNVCLHVSLQWESSSGSGSAGERGGGDWACHCTSLPPGKSHVFLIFQESL